MADRLIEKLRAEIEATTPDVWPRLVRTITARRIADELLAALDRPPSPQSRLGWELLLRVHRPVSLRKVA
jgi:hypothetical protein